MNLASLSMLEEASLVTLFPLSLAALATSAPAVDWIKHWIGPVWTIVLIWTVSLTNSVSLKMSLFFSWIKKFCSTVRILVLLIFVELGAVLDLLRKFHLLLRNRIILSKRKCHSAAFTNNQNGDANRPKSKALVPPVRCTCVLSPIWVIIGNSLVWYRKWQNLVP